MAAEPKSSPGPADRTLPTWARVLLVATGLLRLTFGVSLLVDPASITTLWPWGMTPLTAMLLGASTLVSAPLAVLSGYYNRYSMARIPIVMMLTYRVVQLGAGVLHFDRFDFGAPPAWNYFLGGGFMLLALTYVLLRHRRLGQPVAEPPGRMPRDGPLRLAPAAAWTMDIVGVVFFAAAVAFFLLGRSAGPLWMEAPGKLTPLTARLFASPMAGLALGLWLIVRAARWREALIPAVGMITFGVGGTLTLVVQRSGFAPPSALAGWAALAPLALFLIGLYLLLPARRVMSDA